MSTREMNADHPWSHTIPAAPIDPRLTPKLTPKVTPYGADARAIPGHRWKRKSANPSTKCTPLDAIELGWIGGNRLRNQQVSGSSPLAGSNRINNFTGIEILAKQGGVTTVSPTTRRRVTRYRTTRRASPSGIVAPFPPCAGTARANVSGRYPGNLNQVGLRANADPGLVSCPERGRPGQHAVDLYQTCSRSTSTRCA